MFQIVLCTCPDDTSAQQIATHLVRQKLVACVNIIPKINSIYMWDGEIQDDQEVLLMLKTTVAGFKQLAIEIEELHPYDVAEIIAIDIEQGNTAYLNWLTQMVK